MVFRLRVGVLLLPVNQHLDFSYPKVNLKAGKPFVLSLNKNRKLLNAIFKKDLLYLFVFT